MKNLLVKFQRQRVIDQQFGIVLPEKKLVNQAINSYNVRTVAPNCEIGATPPLMPVRPITLTDQQPDEDDTAESMVDHSSGG